MPLNSSESEQTRRAQEELADKIQLEAKFANELTRLFRRISTDLATTIASTGGTVSAVSYANDLRILMERNYKRIQRQFSGEIILFLQQNRGNLSENIIAELSLIANARGTTVNAMIEQMRSNIKTDLNNFSAFNIAQSVPIITDTTQKEIDKAIQKATQNLTEDSEVPPKNSDLAKETRNLFFTRQIARSKMIAATETQKVAEGTKQIERDNFLSLRNNSTATELDLPPLEAEEIWVTQGDSLVRDGDGTIFNHLAADGQKKVGGAFIVSGESLRFPGDVSLGASAGNVIRCRCAAITVIN